MRHVLWILLGLTLACSSSAELSPITEETLLTDALKSNSDASVITTPSGLKYIVKLEGSGDKAGKGKTVEAHYTGKLMNGKVFDSSLYTSKNVWRRP